MPKYNYRRHYEKHLNMLLGSDVDVHHLDHNKDNNNASNLAAIPKILHQRYHFWHNQLPKGGYLRKPKNTLSWQYRLWEQQQASKAKYLTLLHEIVEIKK